MMLVKFKIEIACEFIAVDKPYKKNSNGLLLYQLFLI